ncbi:hypothetical protein CEXT_483191 [Caerostris extrusa]|uniref:Uncharacterized protein n=1 Tax=Caerostris extrusa TaxID=172846 RepID=A0AAV4Y642_CAEEX|nr:hypothetical protein CEXT_483191 [Caerostris extrusa]
MNPERIVQGHSIDSCGWRLMSVIRVCSSSASSTAIDGRNLFRIWPETMPSVNRFVAAQRFSSPGNNNKRVVPASALVCNTC